MPWPKLVTIMNVKQIQNKLRLPIRFITPKEHEDILRNNFEFSTQHQIQPDTLDWLPIMDQVIEQLLANVLTPMDLRRLTSHSHLTLESGLQILETGGLSMYALTTEGHSWRTEFWIYRWEQPEQLDLTNWE